MDWYYYDINNVKIGPITVKQLKQLAMQGLITPDTIIENTNGRTAVAGKVGLVFPKPAEAPLAEVHEPVTPAPSTEPNPFLSNPMIAESPFVIDNPFVNAPPALASTEPANWYYYTTDKQRIGPITANQLKQLAATGLITPKTLIENINGGQNTADKLRGLTFSTTASAGSQQIENPIKKGGESRSLFGTWEQNKRQALTLIVSLAILACVLIAIGWINNHHRQQISEYGLYSPETISMQIDALINEKNEKRPSFQSWYRLSATEKNVIIDYMTHLQKSTKRKYDPITLNLLLTLLEKIKEGKQLDVYIVNKTHIEAEIDSVIRLTKKRDEAIDQNEKEGLRQAVSDSWDDVKILRNMLQESNRLSGNVHDAEEKERLDKIEQEKRTQSLF